AARVRHRDEAVFRAAARLFELVREGDDLARMAAHEIGDTLERHFGERYALRERLRGYRALSASDRNCLAEAVRGQLDAEHSLASLAALVGMDVRRFTSAFHDAFGLSPWQYVMRARLDAAARLLWYGVEPVTEVALATGFASSSHFATAFARRFGVPPTRYRAAAR
ncbi:MAG TPA: helix-turn-helix transcriptional regulator, partial [Sphingopyxis sp.]|nr:helix-turn-helix transcriptional regulator [Sphingopyxis sp.]